MSYLQAHLQEEEYIGQSVELLPKILGKECDNIVLCCRNSIILDGEETAMKSFGIIRFKTSTYSKLFNFIGR